MMPVADPTKIHLVGTVANIVDANRCAAGSLVSKNRNHKATLTMKKKAGRTPPMLGPNSIAEVQYLTIGGVHQWVMMRGSNVNANPILIMLHGGPGLAAIDRMFWRYFNSKVLEEVYTVIYWDQRGSGKSYDPTAISKDSMTVQQFIADLDELVDVVCNRFHKNKVVLFGHSWGSVLGPLYAYKFPDKVQAYVGCGQLGDWSGSEQETYQWTLNEAERLGNHRAVRDLQKIGPPPHNCDGLCAQRNWLAELEGDTTLHQALKVFYMHVQVPESSVKDMFQIWKILRFSIDAMWSEVTAINLVKEVPELKMPTFFLLGRQDHCVSPKNSMEFINGLTAPQKEVVWFEDSMHMPYMDEPDKFNTTMKDFVRPTLEENSSLNAQAEKRQ